MAAAVPESHRPAMAWISPGNISRPVFLRRNRFLGTAHGHFVSAALVRRGSVPETVTCSQPERLVNSR